MCRAMTRAQSWAKPKKTSVTSVTKISSTAIMGLLCAASGGVNRRLRKPTLGLAPCVGTVTLLCFLLPHWSSSLEIQGLCLWTCGCVWPVCVCGTSLGACTSVQGHVCG